MKADKIRMGAEINSLRLKLAKAKSALAQNTKDSCSDKRYHLFPMHEKLTTLPGVILIIPS